DPKHVYHHKLPKPASDHDDIALHLSDTPLTNSSFNQAKEQPKSQEDDDENSADEFTQKLKQQIKKDQGSNNNKREDGIEQSSNVWRTLGRIQSRQKHGWQDFTLESIDYIKRRGRYIRVQFLDNHGCTQEQYSRYVVEEIAFEGLIFELEAQ
ncbi:hypothetical protein RFI_23524, partial [Reticulomyxa filosa]